MATNTQTDELERNLSDKDLPALLREVCPISLSHVLAFGVQLQICRSKIEELNIRLCIPNKKVDILIEILQEALKHEPPLTRREIITALQDPSVEESELASQIESWYQTSTGSPVTDSGPSPAKRPRKYASPSCLSSLAIESMASTSTYPPLVNDFISFVKTKYNAKKVPRDEKWSLSPTVRFINLALIDRKCVKSKEYNDITREMVMHGNVDAIQRKKGLIELSEIAKGICLPSSGSEQENDRRLILVEGAPGVGKSTFAWEFCRKWMNGEIAQLYHLVLLLRLRDKRIREVKNLKDLFFNPSRPDGSLAVYNELKNSQKFHALIILEGYDELPDSCRNDPSSVFNELISGDSLPFATVLVTSRPWATKNLHVKCASHIYQHIEVLGFTKKTNQRVHQ